MFIFLSEQNTAVLFKIFNLVFDCLAADLEIVCETIYTQALGSTSVDKLFIYCYLVGDKLFTAFIAFTHIFTSLALYTRQSCAARSLTEKCSRNVPITLCSQQS